MDEKIANNENIKGVQRTYGRGAGEREYHEIKPVKNKKRAKSRLYEPGHGPYPQTGVYSAE